MIRYLLDTNICIFYIRGKLDFRQFVEAPWRESCCISEVSILELRYGAEKSNQSQKHHQVVDVFLNGLTVLSITKAIDTYAKEKVRFKKMGISLHDEFDLIIGTSAIANDLILVTDNVKHFINFEGIKIDNWFKR